MHTSGTAAEQKGARITHGNLVGVVEAVTQAYGEVVHDRAVTIIALPWPTSWPAASNWRPSAPA